MTEEKKNLNKVINFRATEEMYNKLIEYLELTGKTISKVMRLATYDYLKFKRFVEENGYGDSKPVKKKKEEVKVDLEQIEANKFCDGDSCEIDPRKMEKR